jgi:nicotinate-nucleotide pyrophosphorylase (carboxylating)
MHRFRELVRASLEEDIGRGDLTTTSMVPINARCKVHLLAKEPGIASGMGIFRMVFDHLEADITDWQAIENASSFESGDDLATFEGKTRAVLGGERVALNFVQRLSGIATTTAKFVKEVEGFDVRICDTRKTTPLLRDLEKNAVVHGGGYNHRHALFDGILIKENHVVAAGGIAKAIELADQGAHHLLKIGVEVETLEELDQALAAKADAVLLDNMNLETMREAVVRTEGTDTVLEASGNVTLDKVREIAETGVHYISVGALTHSAAAVDLSLLIENV